jgi:hypothetical protein
MLELTSRCCDATILLNACDDLMIASLIRCCERDATILALQEEVAQLRAKLLLGTFDEPTAHKTIHTFDEPTAHKTIHTFDEPTAHKTSDTVRALSPAAAAAAAAAPACLTRGVHAWERRVVAPTGGVHAYPTGGVHAYPTGGVHGGGMDGSDSGRTSPSGSLSSRADTGSEASTPTVFAGVARSLADSSEAAAAAAAATAALRTAALVTALEREASSLRLRLVVSEERAVLSEERAAHNERLAAARELEQGCTAPGAADNEERRVELRTLRRRVDAQEQERRAVLSILERRLKPGLEAARTQLQAHQVHSAQHELAALSELVMRSIAALQTDNPYSAH